MTSSSEEEPWELETGLSVRIACDRERCQHLGFDKQYEMSNIEHAYHHIYLVFDTKPRTCS